MTDKEIRIAHSVYGSLAAEIMRFADEVISRENLSAEAEEYVRNLLTETMRFWKEST